MVSLTRKDNRCKTASVIVLASLLGVFVYPAVAQNPYVSYDYDDKPIMVNNVWIDVPLTQILRDISIETSVIIATCPHVTDTLVSLDAGTGKELDKCLNDLIAGQGFFINKRSKKFYLISCGDPTCPSAMETTTSRPLYLKYITSKHLISSVPRSMQKYITSGERGNEVFIYAVPEISEHITEIVSKLDVPRQQVVLEVLVVDLWEDSSDELGLDWSYSGPHTSLSMAEGTAGFAGLGSYASIAASNLTELSLSLRALVAEKRASIRSRPRVATLNGEKAMIDISLDEYFTIATDLYGTSLRTELEVIKSGVMLEITPHIGDDGNITVDVLTEVSDVASRRNSSSNNTASDGDLPVIRRRKVETHVRVKEGDAIVIGGLVETQKTTDHRKVPLLGSLPLIGGLFKSKSDSTVKKEVMIFITPRLMSEGEIVISDRHELIDENQEIEELRDVATLFDVRHKHKQNVKAREEEAQFLNEAVDLLEGDERSDKLSHQSSSAGRVSSKLADQERRVLQEAIALLDEKKP
ncbi:type II secretion system protein GspD [Planctomycetota bacterium]